ncbi:hypothetical protein DY000_02008492 [Brassica cretica]|uniref:Uncharacterized protein n=1 Tax=Brassica cretica TaxID=69181 RepID=A0ABQ7CJV2_BRACR|nr:hypothetical protein DY000_02008492 [Brassica cretica]
MGVTSPERHREVAVTPFQSDLTGATQRGRSRLHHPERRDLERPSEVARVSITRSDVTGATQRGRSRLHHPERRDQRDTARSLAKKRPGSDLSQRRAEGDQG